MEVVTMSNEISIDGQTVSQEEIKRALALLESQKNQRAKQRENLKNNPEQKAKADARALRLRVKNTILQKKAVQAGITVSDAEVDAYLSSRAAEAVED
jgi:FKBP-type peptidyl-prolyl cis-trans isomerase (trigger factor)